MQTSFQYRLERGKWRRTSEVYKDKVLQWTVSGHKPKLENKKSNDPMVLMLRYNHTAPKIFQSSTSDIHIIPKDSIYRRRFSI